MLFLVGNVGEPIGYVFCVFPLVEFCLRPDFRVYTVENLLADFTEFAFCGINKAAGWVVGEVDQQQFRLQIKKMPSTEQRIRQVRS